MTRRRLLAVAGVAIAIASPSGATIALGTTTITCKARLAETQHDLAIARENGAQSYAAYQDAVDHLENARPLVRQAILEARRRGISWAAIKASPIGKAFYGPLFGR